MARAAAMSRPAALALALAAAAGVAPGFRAAARAPDARIAPRVMTLTRDTRWTPAGAIPLRFRAFHPQGLAKVGDAFFLSSVEVRTPPSRLDPSQGGRDRDAGAGVGHLFKFDARGELLADIVLGEGAVYHPGGIDFDGAFLWVPVAEYRPDSRSRIYRVDPVTLQTQLVLRVDDHIGGVAYDAARRELHGVSWGSRRFYRWRLDGRGRPIGPAMQAPNPEHYIDYQGCHALGGRRMLCAGVASFRPRLDGPPLALGGLDLIDLRDHRPRWQVPVPLWSPSGQAMTTNPFDVEATTTGLRAYFAPDDDATTLYVFDAAGR